MDIPFLDLDSIPNPISADTIVSPLRYTGDVREQFLKAKLQGNSKSARELIASALFELNDWIHENSWDLIIPVPPHLGRTLHTQVHLPSMFANSISRRTRGHRLRVRERAALRWRGGWHRPSQRRLTPGERFENVKERLQLRWPPVLVAGRALLIVDDVITTGATASQATRVFRELAPLRIDFATLAHPD